MENQTSDLATNIMGAMYIISGLGFVCESALGLMASQTMSHADRQKLNELLALYTQAAPSVKQARAVIKHNEKLIGKKK